MQRKLLTGAAALAIVAGAAYWLASTPANEPGISLGAANAQESDEAVDTSGIVEMTMGAEDAPVTVVEYASFTCPHCANFHTGPGKKLKAEYIDNGDVKFVYRDVFFDRFGLWASMIARCDGGDRFFGIADMLYKQQKDWIGSGDPVEIANNLRKIGKTAGLDDDQVEQCLQDNDKAKALVAWFQQHAEEDEINATPTLIINGEKHSNMSYADLKEIVEAELAQE
ncbi:DsbA family protein [Roseovarius sp. A21]|uniref:DsbA family protein n=1 Tax=Roseovarius bejariae TaxID=2576383 RepID=A0A844CP33_9RHOB|nr:DsbA family protein [Roseovarius bejariae]MRU15235.1 DsbA family protein [Roseovarius bejariae]